MKKKYNVTISNQRKILFVLIFMSLSIGLWSNFRQLWLQENGMAIDDISRLISLGMFGSCFLAIIVSVFSTKLRIKEMLTLSFSISIISMLGLMFSYNSENLLLIKTFILLTIITDNLFWIGIYPLFTTVKKSNEIYEKKSIYQNIFKDIGVLVGGLVVGRTIGSFVLDTNICLLFSIIFSMISLYFLLMIRYEHDKENEIETKSFKDAFKVVVKNKNTNTFLYLFLFCKYSVGYTDRSSITTFCKWIWFI